MSKRYINTAIVYAILAMVGGVFYREYTKAIGFDGVTTLSVVHTHYFMLGMVVFLLLALLDKSFAFSTGKHVGGWLVAYQVGLNITVLGLVVRGLADAQNAVLSAGMNASIYGISGLGHIILGTSLLVTLFTIRNTAAKPVANP